MTFDVGGTLIEPWPSVGHVYAEVAARNGFKDIPPELLNERFRTAWREFQPFEHSRKAWERVVDLVFLDVCEPPSRTFFQGLYDRFSEAAAWRIFEDIAPTLETLASRGIKLGIISNWDERLRGLLRALELDRYFQVFAISCEVGFPKPSRVIFERAAAGLGLPSRAILHIGDSPEMDLAGGRLAGFRALRINRNAGQRATPVMMVTLTELPARIGKMGSG